MINKLSILIIEPDNIDFIRIDQSIGKWLHQSGSGLSGYQVNAVRCKTLAQAKIAIRENHFDLCLVNPYVVDAWPNTLLTELRSLSNSSLIIALVLIDNAQLRADLMSWGATDVIMKDFVDDTIARILSTLLDQSTQEQISTDDFKIIEQITTIFDLDPTSVVITTKSGKILYFNEAVRALFNKLDCLDLLSDNNFPWKDLTLGSSVEYKLADHHFLVTTTAIQPSAQTQSNNQVQYLRYSIIDLTEKHAELTRLTQTLESQTEKINSQSEQIQSYLQQINSLKTKTSSRDLLFASLSHEIRTPLTSVIGYTELLLTKLNHSHSLSDEPIELDVRTESGLINRSNFATLPDNIAESDLREALRAIMKNSNYLLDLLSNVIDFAKIESDNLELQESTVSVYSLMSEIEKIISVRARNKGVEFRVIYDFPLPDKIHVDGVRLKQILINLAGNGIKFTYRGGVSITVSYGATVESLIFEVGDTGIGIPDKVRSNLFNLFSHGENSNEKGFGLGLYLSQKLAKLLGSEIKLIRSSSKGTVFSFNLPLSNHQKLRLVDRFSNSIGYQEYSEILNDKFAVQGTVLLAEDSTDARNLVEALLKAIGIKTFTVTNGQEALNFLEQNQVDLILMDMQMPILSGYKAVQQLRRQGYTKPIIAFTAEIPIDKTDSIFNLCDDFIPKPFPKNELYSAISKFLPNLNYKSGDSALSANS